MSRYAAFKRLRSKVADDDIDHSHSCDGRKCFMARCPAHDDPKPSLHVTAVDKRSLIHCFAGCGHKDVLGKWGMTVKDLFDNREGADYAYSDGVTVRRRYLKDDKKISQIGKDKPKDGYALYNLDYIEEAIEEGEPIYVTEGEDDADNMADAYAVYTTTFRGGAGNWHKTDWSPVKHAHLILVVDNDEKGMQSFAELAVYLRDELDCEVEVKIGKVERDKSDISDHIAAGYGLEDLENCVLEDDNPDRLPPPSEPLAVARAIEDEFRRDGVHTLWHWRGTWWEWGWHAWFEADQREISSRLYKRTERCHYLNSKGYALDWAPTKVKIGNLADALMAILIKPGTVEPNTWHPDPAERPEGQIVACTNGLLEVETRELLPHDPRYFNMVSVPFDYDEDAECPLWLEFLDQLWPDDEEQIVALQDWLGYLVSGRTDLQKIFQITGPTRSGKGTIGHIAEHLVGPRSTVGPTLASLSENFGLAGLIGKSLALISDARVGSKTNRDVVVERLLTISGEDPISVARKYKDDWFGPIGARIMILSNEQPALADASGTIAHRFISLRHTESFLGREDPSLKSRLREELPGILNWALEGLDRVTEQGYLTEPAVSREILAEQKRDASPTFAFIEDECTIGAGLEAPVDQVWSRWQQWCEANGRRSSNKQMFGRNLSSVVPGLTVSDRSRYKHRRWYVGLTLKNVEEIERGPRLKG